MAMLRLSFCERISARALSPVGACLATMHEFVVFRCWPPGPVPLVASMITSRIFRLNAPCDWTGSTATVIVELWTRPLRSFGGILCHLWPPD